MAPVWQCWLQGWFPAEEVWLKAVVTAYGELLLFSTQVFVNLFDWWLGRVPSERMDMSRDSRVSRASHTSDVGTEVRLLSREKLNDCLSQARVPVVGGICHH